MNEIRGMLADILRCHPDDLVPDSGLGHTAHWDSLAQLSIMLLLEDRFGIEISDETIRKYSTLSAIEDLVRKQVR